MSTLLSFSIVVSLCYFASSYVADFGAFSKRKYSGKKFRLTVPQEPSRFLATTSGNIGFRDVSAHGLSSVMAL